MFDSLKPGRMQLLLDPPPRGIFTYEDTVSGKVIFESTKDVSIGYVYVFFHGRVRTDVTQSTRNNYGGGPASTETFDVETLFQYEKKVYEGVGKIPKNTHLEWPFMFDFRHPDVDDPSALPTSGKYGLCHVEYKLEVACGQIGQDEVFFRKMFNPDDVLFQKNSPIRLDAIRGTVAKHLGIGAEELLQFLQIRPSVYVGNDMAGPFSVDLQVHGSYLPSIRYDGPPPERHGIFHASQPGIPFAVNLELPKNIVEGMPFPVYISVTSPSQEWTANPPPVRLASIKMRLLARTVSRASRVANEDEHQQAVLDAKNLDIQLGPQWLDVGQLLQPTLMGNGLVPSFNSRLLQRAYDLPTEVTVDIAGKTLKASFSLSGCIELMSQVAATGQPPPRGAKDEPRSDPLAAQASGTKKIRLKHTYVGRITQDGGGPLRADSVMEAALALSRVLTAAGIQHEFPSGASLRLLPYTPPRGSGLNDKNYDQRQDDREVLQKYMQEHFVVKERPSDVLGVCCQYTDPLHRESITIEFPRIFPAAEHWQKEWLKDNRDRTDEVSIDPVSLLNYRLNCALNRELADYEIGDFQSLYASFEKNLYRHRKQIDANTAMIAAGRYAVIRQVLEDIGLELGAAEASKVPGVAAGGAAWEVPPRVSDPSSSGYGGYAQAQLGNEKKALDAGYFRGGSEERRDQAEGHEEGHEGLLKGFKNLLHHKHHHDR